MLLLPGLALLKEWAYAGVTFALVMATISSYLSGEGAKTVLPLVLLALVGGIIGTTCGLIRAETALEAEAHERTKAEQAVLAEAALAYLGLGTQPPYPSWGLMLKEAQNFLSLNPWFAVFPGGAIALTVLGLNLLGDGLRDLLDPKTA